MVLMFLKELILQVKHHLLNNYIIYYSIFIYIIYLYYLFIYIIYLYYLFILDWTCLKNQGYNFAIVRVYRSSGTVDPNGSPTINDAWSGTYIYLKPLSYI
jgi:hypothetical protein